MAALRHVLLLQRDVPKAATFYSRGLGLKVKVLTERWAELEAGSTTLALKAVDGEACCSVGYSPFLTFTVKELQTTLTQLLQLGSTMDGGVQHLPRGLTAVVRAPDGHMISLFEPAEQ
ncbi:hypothetical protein WJX73_000177 [Symbiochloris irregularis]|uniref:VOC domain-containing protein n=1 Tax=Symbiochloris irregularis TaxID=706552 RepID=A0AAW1PBX6_9CHLO